MLVVDLPGLWGGKRVDGVAGRAQKVLGKAALRCNLTSRCAHEKGAIRLEISALLKKFLRQRH